MPAPYSGPWSTVVNPPAPWTIDQTYTPGPGPSEPPAGGAPAPPKNSNKTPDNGHFVLIESRGLHWDLKLLLGDGFMQPSNGGATFDEITAPSDKTMVDWTGEGLWKMAVPIMLDAWIDPIQMPKTDKSPPAFKSIKKKKKRKKARTRWRNVRDRDRPANVDQYVTQLVELQAHQGKRRPPAGLRVYGKAIQKKFNGMEWYIESVDFGDAMYNPRNSQLVRQAMTLNLIEAHDGTPYKLKKHKKDKGGNSGKEMYRVKKGDTLQKIAAKFYGDASKWERIAKANGIKNPRKLDKYVGEKIKIP